MRMCRIVKQKLHKTMRSKPSAYGQPNPKEGISLAIDPIAQVRSELGWLSLLTVLIGEERARAILVSAMNHSANDAPAAK